MEARGRDWRTVLLAIGATGGALFVLAWAALILVFSMVTWMQGGNGGTSSSPLDIVVTLSALLAIGAVFVLAAYYSFARLSGRGVAPAAPDAMRPWQAGLLSFVWIAAAFTAQLLINVPFLKWITPALYVLAIAVPVYFFARLATGGLDTGSRQRLWGIMAAGIGLGTTLAIVAEVVLALLGVIALGVYVSMHPENVRALLQLAQQLRNVTSPEQALNLVSPWINSPVAVITALLFFSVFSPLIEETSKSLATWTVFDRLATPGQGFAMGALSGAAFGLVESLLVSANPQSSWSTTLLVRGASTMMHIMAASLTGWGIASFRVSKNAAKLIGLYLLAMALHGLWNACVVAITFGGLRTTLAPNGSDVLGTVLVFAGIAILIILCLMIPAGLGILNWRFRAAQARARAGAEPMRPASSMPSNADQEVPWALEKTDEKMPEDDTKPSPPAALP